MFYEFHGVRTQGKKPERFLLNEKMIAWVTPPLDGENGCAISFTDGSALWVVETYADIKAALGTQHVGLPVSS